MADDPPAAPAKGEHRLAASLAIIVSALLGLLLPESLTLGPSLVTLIAVAVLLVPLLLYAPMRTSETSTIARVAALVLLAVIAIANYGSLAFLIEQLLNGHASGTMLLRAALIIWIQNVVLFAVVFWELDCGGPDTRAAGGRLERDFLFPQLDVTSVAAAGWRPTFLDYLYTSCTNASAFSPTDVLPLTHQAKLAMMAQSLPSLITIVLVTARAVNIIS